jgi:Mg-chelatase subunit ChlD
VTRRILSIGGAILLAATAVAAQAELGNLRVEIHSPQDELLLPNTETSLEVEGGASIFGGVKQLDLVLVMDTSQSLSRTDPRDYRAEGAVGLVRGLSQTSDIQVSVVDFNWDAKLIVPLTPDRSRVVNGLQQLGRSGATDLAAGIQTALAELEQGARDESSRVILLFTDGKSDAEEAMDAAALARRRGVAVHTLLLGSDKKGAEILGEIAKETGGSFLRVTDPAGLPQAFLNLRTTGVQQVTLRANDAEPVAARLVGGTFSGQVPLREGENLIVAEATSLDGRTSQDVISVTVRAPGCGELQVEAMSEGQRALSLSDRAVEIVFDASNSMWGQIDGEAKVGIAKEILSDALDWLPSDLQLGLRVYGHQHPREQGQCTDSELLVAHGADSRGQIREAIGSFRPRGQTPLAYSIAQVAGDFGDFDGERAVVLVTDGIESCGGDPVGAARALQQQHHIPIHVIGFGLGQQAAADEASLRLIAEASGGRFVAATNAEELRDALAVTVGTPFAVWQGERPVARGSLGANDRIRLPAGDYVVRLESAPPQQAPVRLVPEENLTLVLDRHADGVSQRAHRREAGYFGCEGSPQALTAAPTPRPQTAVVGAAEATPETSPASGSDTTQLARSQPETEPAASTQPPAAATPETRTEPTRPVEPEPRTQAEPQAAQERVASQTQAPKQEKARRTGTLEVEGGSVEIWEIFLPEREPWVVVLRHPSVKQGAVTVWSGSEKSDAEHVARGVKNTLRGLDWKLTAAR